MKISLPFVCILAIISCGFPVCYGQAPEGTPAPLPGQAVRDAALQTRVFQVPPGFLSSRETPARDPFASGPPAKPSIQEVLESMGISFDARGSSVTYDAAASRLVLKNTLEQLDGLESILAAAFVNPGRQGHIHLEIFSLPPLAARQALISHPRESALYAWLEAQAANKDGPVRLEHHSVTLVRGGQKSVNEAIDEIPRGTEFSPPRIPQDLGLPVAPVSTTSPGGGAVFAPWPRAGTTPQSIEFRNTGHTLEVELSFGNDGQTVDLNLAPQTSRRIGMVKWGLLEEIQQPVYETQKCSAQVSNLTGQPTLVSTFSPPLNTGVPGSNTVDRTWLLFVTVTKPE